MEDLVMRRRIYAFRVTMAVTTILTTLGFGALTATRILQSGVNAVTVIGIGCWLLLVVIVWEPLRKLLARSSVGLPPR